MDIANTRLNKLLSWSRNYKTDAEFASALNMAPSYYGQIKRGERNIGEKVARKIEESLGQPSGWLDNINEKGIDSGSLKHSETLLSKKDFDDALAQQKEDLIERTVIAAMVCVDSVLRGDELVDMVNRVMTSDESYDQIMKFRFEQFIDELVYEKDIRDVLKATWQLNEAGMQEVLWAAEESEHKRKTPRTQLVQPAKKAG